MTDKDNAFLEDFFAAARAADDAVPDALLDRVIADAALVPRMPVKETLWSSLVAAIGGWPALSGVAMAGLIGIWVGFVPPTQLESFAADVLGTTTSVTFIDEFDDFLGAELGDG